LFFIPAAGGQYQDSFSFIHSTTQSEHPLFFAMLQRRRRLKRQISWLAFCETGDMRAAGQAPAGAGGNLYPGASALPVSFSRFLHWQRKRF
jgi:hypothetical protein